MMVHVSRLDSPLPWFPWYPQEWRTDRYFQRLSWAEKGLLRELLDECYLGRTIPADVEGLAELLAVDATEIRELLPRLLRWLTMSGDGRLESLWVERVRANQDQGRIRQAQRRSKATREAPSTTVHRGEEGEEKEDKKEKGDESRGTSPALPGTSPLLLPCKGKGMPTWAITGEMWAEWEKSFPGVDLLVEVRKMRRWLEEDPSRLRPSERMWEFVRTWLSRAIEWNERNGRSRQGEIRFASRTPDLDNAFLDQLRKGQAESSDASS